MCPKPTLSVLPEEVSIAQLGVGEPIPDWAHKEIFSSITRTANELSIVTIKTQVVNIVTRSLIAAVMAVIWPAFLLAEPR